MLVHTNSWVQCTVLSCPYTQTCGPSSVMSCQYTQTHRSSSVMSVHTNSWAQFCHVSTHKLVGPVPSCHYSQTCGSSAQSVMSVHKLMGPVLSGHYTQTSGPSALSCHVSTHIPVGPVLSCQHTHILVGPVLSCQYTQTHGPSALSCHVSPHKVVGLVHCPIVSVHTDSWAQCAVLSC